MDKDRFWQIIDNARTLAGDWKIMEKSLIESLSKLEAPEIIKWSQIFYEYLEHADQKRLCAAKTIITNGCSDDSFQYFIGWLIAQGKKTYLNALKDPDSLSENETIKKYAHEIAYNPLTPLQGYSNTPVFEEILYVAVIAYENKVGKGDDFYDLASKPLTKEEENEIAKECTYKDWTEIPDRLEKWLPQLCNKFNNRS